MYYKKCIKFNIDTVSYNMESYVMNIIKKNKQQLFIGLLCFLFVIWSQREIFVVSTTVGYRMLEATYTICMTLTLTKMLLFLLFEKDGSIVSPRVLRCYGGLLIVQIMAFLPMYTQNFMYGDDLWGYKTDFGGDVSPGMYFSRPFVNFLSGFLLNNSFDSIRFVRILNGLFLFGFGCILIRFITMKIQKTHIAFFVAVMAVVSCSAVDCIAYASVTPINSSLMISAASFVIYQEAMASNGSRKIIGLVESCVCLFTAFCLYQIGTPIVFLFYVIAEKYSSDISERERFKRAFLYLIYYGLTAVFYLLITKLFQILTGVASGQAARGKMISSFAVLCNKVYWFFTEVFPQALIKLIGNVCGNTLFIENNMFYKCTFLKTDVGIILNILLIILIICSIGITSYHKKSIVYGLVGVMAIPLAFYPFLILPESVFLTYYAMPLILLLMWYVVDGIRNIVCIISSKWDGIKKVKRLKKVCFAVLILTIALQSNYYAENAWVNYCRDSYEYLANYISAELAARDNIDTIIVKGVLSPYVGGRDYVIFCVEDILIELGYPVENYHVVQVDNGYYLISFPGNELEGMREKLGNEKLERVLQYYTHDDLYGRWSYNYTIETQDEMEFLRECFEMTGQLAKESASSISIDMRGFHQRNSF